MDIAAQTTSLTIDSFAMESARLASQREELAELIRRRCPTDGQTATAIPGLMLFRGSSTGACNCTVATSVFAMMAQGAKRIAVGGETYDYDAGKYLISSVELPMRSHLTRASVLQPYLGMALAIDPLKLGELAAAMPENRAPQAVDRGIAIGRLSADIQDAALRLVHLLDSPADIPVLAPLIERELLYRLLSGEHGWRLRQVAASGSHGQRIVRAIDWLKTNLDQPVSIDQLADLANMSRSSLHFHFKTLTAMTPLQYQKQLRLHEARRLMLVADHDAASAAHRVGYESPSQFSREYRRMFGTPPARDVAQLRVTDSHPAGAAELPPRSP